MPRPGDGMVHPVPLAALALLVINDHVLKGAYPGLITGKLSDVVGLIFFPLLVVALIEVSLAAVRRFRAPSARVLVGSVLVSGALFSLMKTWDPAGDVYRVAQSLLQWPFFLLRALIEGAPVPAPQPVRHVVDPTDLLALPSLLLAYAVGRARVMRGAAIGAIGASA